MIFQLPAHVAFLRDLLATARPLHGRPDQFTPVVGWHVRWPKEEEFVVYEECVRRGLLVKKEVGVPGECHPFESAEVLALTDSAHDLLAAYKEAT